VVLRPPNLGRRLVDSHLSMGSGPVPPASSCGHPCWLDLPAVYITRQAKVNFSPLRVKLMHTLPGLLSVASVILLG
jgi:hypothetical protein